MKKATVRQLRHAFPTVLEWIDQGEKVQISKRGKVVAILTPPRPRRKPDRPVKMPDFMARLKENYGNRVIPAEVTQHIIDENRGRY